jgi:hypothetical protein
VKATNVSQQLNQLLRDNAPEDLRRINRAKLRDAGLNRQLIEDFLNHPQYSPRHTTFLTDALANIGGARGKGLFLRMALSAESEEDALLFQRLAEMMRGYHDKISPVKEITLINDLPAIYAHNDALVLPLVLDYGVWTEAGDLIAQALSSFELDRERILSREAWITGSLSPRARKELAARGIAVHEGAFDELYPQPGGSEQTE